jgi:hypothetical protein
MIDTGTSERCDWNDAAVDTGDAGGDQAWRVKRGNLPYSDQGGWCRYGRQIGKPDPAALSQDRHAHSLC